MYLGLDLGTSSLKALLVDEAQQPIGEASVPLSVQRPQPSWSEQDPDAWVAAAEQALDALAAEHGDALRAVRGISLSGQMHGAVVLGRDHRPLRPCMLWNDTRAHIEAAALDADPRFRAINGNIVFPGFTAPKLAWLRAHEPARFDAIDLVMLPKDYLRLWLCGTPASEMSDAAGTSWLHTGERRWSETLLATSGMTSAQMPPLFEGSDAVEAMRPELARRWGFSRAPVIGAGAGDNAAAAIGMGAIGGDAAFVSIGTSGVVFAANDNYRPNADSAVHAFCHALPGRWHQMGVMLSATDSLNWLARLCGQSPQAMVAALGETLQPPGESLFLPYLGGERTPHNLAGSNGTFTGLGHGDDAVSLCRAVLEGVCFALADNLDALRAAGTQPERLLAVGGGSQSDYWLSLLATVLGVPVERPVDSAAGAAAGAARLAQLAATGEAPAAVCPRPAVARMFEPVESLRPAMCEAQRRFRAVLPGLQGVRSGC